MVKALDAVGGDVDDFELLAKAVETFDPDGEAPDRRAYRRGRWSSVARFAARDPSPAELVDDHADCGASRTALPDAGALQSRRGREQCRLLTSTYVVLTGCLCLR